jgi:hypothetical protein
MSDTKIVILILTAIILFLYIVSNIISLNDIEFYKKKYDYLQRGVYKFEPQPGLLSAYFYLYDYNVAEMVYTKTDVSIVFFDDGDIKLSENKYLHKSQLWMSITSWYYYRKLHKLKDQLIRDYNFYQAYNRMSSNRNRVFYFEKRNIDFKFFRG